VLDEDVLEHVRDVLAATRRVLEEVEDLLPLDDDEWIVSLFEQPLHGPLMGAVGLVLEPVHLQETLRHSRARVEGLKGFVHLLHARSDDARELSGSGHDLLDPTALPGQ